MAQVHHSQREKFKTVAIFDFYCPNFLLISIKVLNFLRFFIGEETFLNRYQNYNFVLNLNAKLGAKNVSDSVLDPCENFSKPVVLFFFFTLYDMISGYWFQNTQIY